MHAPSAQSTLHSLRSALHRDPAEARLRLALACFALHSQRLYQRWAFANAADYVRGRLGIPLARYYDLVGAGRLLTTSARVRDSFLAGRLELSAVAILGRSVACADVESSLPQLEPLNIEQLRAWIASRRKAVAASDAAADPNYLRVSLTLPQSAARYCEETLRLARALCGGELPDDEALAAVLAEASTEVELPSQPGDVHRAFRTARSRRRSAPLPSARRDEADAALALLGLTGLRSSALALRLDRLLRREIRKLDDLGSRTEDRLLDAVNDGLPERLGYRSLRQFFALGLQLPPSTGFEWLRRARQRRRRDPLATARAAGTISTVAALYLERLRQLGVPASCMRAWIDEAEALTVRQLRRAIDWAVRQSQKDQLAWSLEDYRPPTSTEVQTSERSLHDLLADSRPPAATALANEPTTRISFTLRREHAQFLADLTQQPDTTPRWWRILRLFHLARDAWEKNTQIPRNPRTRILERDSYQCQAPECSNRRALEVHHIHYRSHQGTDDPNNLITLCAWHHRQGEHGQHLRVRGEVNKERDKILWELGRNEAGDALLRYRGERRCA